jgi:hypothetical protein
MSLCCAQAQTLQRYVTCATTICLWTVGHITTASTTVSSTSTTVGEYFIYLYYITLAFARLSVKWSLQSHACTHTGTRTRAHTHSGMPLLFVCIVCPGGVSTHNGSPSYLSRRTDRYFPAPYLVGLSHLCWEVSWVSVLLPARIFSVSSHCFPMHVR